MQASLLERLPLLVADEPWLVHRGRHLEACFLLGVGGVDYLVRIHAGRVEAVEMGPFVQPCWTFALRASSEAWETFWKPLPPPGGHDLMAMIKTKALRLEGDPYLFMANLRYFKELLALPRQTIGGTANSGGRR